jgi:hypothetical protein
MTQHDTNTATNAPHTGAIPALKRGKPSNDELEARYEHIAFLIAKGLPKSIIKRTAKRLWNVQHRQIERYLQKGREVVRQWSGSDPKACAQEITERLQGIIRDSDASHRDKIAALQLYAQITGCDIRRIEMSGQLNEAREIRLTLVETREQADSMLGRKSPPALPAPTDAPEAADMPTDEDMTSLDGASPWK